MEQLQEYIRHLESRAKAAEAALADLLEERPDFDDAIRHRQEHRRCGNCRYFKEQYNAVCADGACHAWFAEGKPAKVLAYPYCSDHPSDEDIMAELLVKKEFGCVHFVDKHQEKGGIVLGVDAEG